MQSLFRFICGYEIVKNDFDEDLIEEYASKSLETNDVVKKVIEMNKTLPDDKKYNVMHILLVMLASGATGNLIDRVSHDYVVDFIYFVLINFPIFNVADIYVTVSTFLFVILFIFYYKENDFDFLSFKQKEKIKDK